MGHFFAGYRTDGSKIKELESSFINVVPPEIRNDILRIEDSASFLTSFGSSKVISDILIQNKKTSSWLAILGTPLIQLPKEEKKAEFLDRFSRDPTNVIKNELDGCFALLSYNTLSNVFCAATDVNNTTPIYYAVAGKSIYFSSHELPLARFLGSEIDPLGFSLTIQVKVPWGTITRFNDIHKLLPCQIMTFCGDQKPASHQYWTAANEAQWPLSFDEVVDRWLTLLKRSVKAFYDCSDNKTVICEITAGEDSRLLLSECHASGIPFLGMVDGSDTDTDVLVAKEASCKTGFELIVRPKPVITEDQLLNNATYISLKNDGYQDFFESCSAFATDAANSPRNYEYLKYCGAPGGEAFRGSYYLRGKALFPSRQGNFDYRFFTRLKFLLDFHPGLLRFPDAESKKTIYMNVDAALEDVRNFPLGTRIDHLLRVFQTCNTGLIYKNPRYLPFATMYMTPSIYDLPPHFKRGGRLTKACTEILFPEIASIKTQKGVPTIRKTPLRFFLFMPEYLSTAKSIMRGTASRLLKWTESNKPAYKWSKNAPAITTLLNKPPYSSWFASSRSMITGHLYNSDVIDSLLKEAKSGASKYIPILGRIINQEIACRWINR